MKSKTEILRMTMLAMLIAIGVVISPILRIEGMCPMAHLINIACSVFMGPWYSLLCATLIGIIRMSFMGIPPLALTGAVFGAFLSGVFYRASKGKLICAVLGEVIGTGIIGSIISYPIIGGTIAFVFLAALRRTGMLTKIQRALGARTYDLSNTVSPASAADQS